MYVNDCRLLVTLVSDLPRTMHRECFTSSDCIDQCLDSFGSTTLDPHGSTTKLITCQRNIPKYHVVMLVSSCNPNFLPPMPLVGQHERNLCQVNDLGRTSKSVLIDESSPGAIQFARCVTWFFPVEVLWNIHPILNGNGLSGFGTWNSERWPFSLHVFTP